MLIGWLFVSDEVIENTRLMMSSEQRCFIPRYFGFFKIYVRFHMHVCTFSIFNKGRYLNQIIDIVGTGTWNINRYIICFRRLLITQNDDIIRAEIFYSKIFWLLRKLWKIVIIIIIIIIIIFISLVKPYESVTINIYVQ